MGTPNGLPLFDHLRSVLLFLITQIIFLDNIVRRPHLMKVDSNCLLLRIVVVPVCFVESNQSPSNRSTKENNLILASPGFEPTTFLFHGVRNWRLRPLGHRRPTGLVRIWIPIVLKLLLVCQALLRLSANPDPIPLVWNLWNTKC